MRRGLPPSTAAFARDCAHQKNKTTGRLCLASCKAGPRAQHGNSESQRDAAPRVATCAALICLVTRRAGDLGLWADLYRLWVLRGTPGA